ncbi:MAG: hypothetical protein M0C28_00730 [Candidatus Moduliflexus flocculans]|nr:hypothetical protein [Candidatus Moduliflexus flocculans]
MPKSQALPGHGHLRHRACTSSTTATALVRYRRGPEAVRDRRAGSAIIQVMIGRHLRRRRRWRRRIEAVLPPVVYITTWMRPQPVPLLRPQAREDHHVPDHHPDRHRGRAEHHRHADPDGHGEDPGHRHPRWPWARRRRRSDRIFFFQGPMIGVVGTASGAALGPGLVRPGQRLRAHRDARRHLPDLLCPVPDAGRSTWPLIVGVSAAHQPSSRPCSRPAGRPASTPWWR